MKRWLIIGLAVVVLGIIVVANLKGSSGPEASARLAEVTRGDVTATITAPGRLRAVATVNISAEVPGRVVELAVAEGDSVSQGDVLLRLDDTVFKSRVSQSQAALASARAALKLAQARLERAESDLKRVEALFAKGLAAQERMENALSDASVQRAETESRRQEVERFQAALEEARDNLDKTVYRAPVSGIVSHLNIERGENVIVGRSEEHTSELQSH